MPLIDSYTICGFMKTLVPTICLNVLISVGLFFVSFYLAWQVSASTNFIYPFWYEVIKIDTAITKYAPYNKNRHGFENTNKQEHVRLFRGIVSSIQNSGTGLDQLKYSDNNGNVIDTLLTQAEVIHLTDVANLVNKFKYFAIAGGLIAFFSFLILLFSKYILAKFRYHFFGGIGLIIFFTLLVIIIGPTDIFYAGHELIFPDQHQWFFYYEDSLMSTMMKAPVLFAPIAGELIILTIILWSVFLYLMIRAKRKL